MEEMDKLLDQYEAKFGECFPIRLCMGLSDEKICELVQACLEHGKPYAPDLDGDADY